MNSANFVKRRPSLIGGNAPLPPVKLRKCGGEGNFVKLNMNRSSKRKFVNRGRGRNSYASSGRKSYRRGRRRLRPEGGNEGENNSVCEEDGLVAESAGQRQKKYDCYLVEAAVSAARNEPSDENLVRLLKVVYGYDSFRDGQLEAIRMVLAGESTMLVLPTGAGKSLCYQLPAMVLPGITVVVSPLVALMIDQLRHLPPMIRGGLLCSSQVLYVLSFFHTKSLNSFCD